MPPKEIGVTQTDGVDAFYSVDPAKTLPILCAQGVPGALTPVGVGAFISNERAIHERRKIVVLVEGDLGWCQRYHGSLPWAAAVVYVTDPATLEALGVPCIDCAWTEDQPSLGVLEDHLASRMVAGRS